MADTSSFPQLAVTIEPIGDRVVVLPLPAEATTASGIVIPDVAQEKKPQEGRVIALGSGGIGKDSINPQEFLKVGDNVLFGRYAGDDVKIKDQSGKEVEVKILHLDAVLGIVRS